MRMREDSQWNRPTGYQRHLVSGLACKLYSAGLLDKPMLDKLMREMADQSRSQAEKIYQMLRDADAQI